MVFRLVGVSSSPMKKRSTYTLLHHALEHAKAAVLELVPEAEVEVTEVCLAQKKILPCCDCHACTRKGTLCVLKDDWLECMDPILNPSPPDGLILAAPVYFHGTNSQIRAFMERWTSLFKPIWHKEIQRKPPDFTKTVAGAVSVGAHRNGGVEEAVNSMLSFLISVGFLTVGSFDLEHGSIGYTGGTGYTAVPGFEDKGIAADEWGMLSAAILGRRIGETAVRLRLGRTEVLPRKESEGS